MLNEETKNEKEIIAKFLNTLSSFKLSTYCKEMGINKPDVYTGRTSKEKAYNLANRISKDVFLLVIETSQSLGKNINEIKRRSLSLDNKQENITMIKDFSSLSILAICEELGLHSNNIILCEATLENMKTVYDKVNEELCRIFF